ncbi:hypothetical protein pdam_00025701, partial [Pocillopora damicornis]
MPIGADECNEQTHNCHKNADCVDLPEGFYCNCKSGFSGDGQTCEDINECEFPTACHKDAYCNNYRGSYNCTCVSGYNGNGTVCL